MSVCAQYKIRVENISWSSRSQDTYYPFIETTRYCAKVLVLAGFLFVLASTDKNIWRRCSTVNIAIAGEYKRVWSYEQSVGKSEPRRSQICCQMNLAVSLGNGSYAKSAFCFGCSALNTSVNLL